jgi:bacillithiol biosynthesis deacetylase BshB1
MTVDYLLFGAHPDDVEWGAGGISLVLREKKQTFAITDLTRGELGSRGTPEERAREAQSAAEFLGASVRDNLDMSDGFLVDSPEARLKVASVIRRCRPKVVLAPYWRDRHPDHAAAGRLIRNSALYCTLRKTNDPNPPHRPALFLYYLLHHFRRPALVVDISALYARKLEALRFHGSQFSRTASQYGVIPLGLDDYLFGLESRDRFFGSLIGVKYGEAFCCDAPLSLAQTQILSELLP